MFTTLFINIFSVFLMMIPGYLVVRKNIVKESALKDFSHVIVKVLYPSLIFSSITKNFTICSVLESWQLPVSVFVLSIIGYIIGMIHQGFFKVDDVKRQKSILFQFTINNFSFLPLAIVAKLYDEQHMAAVIISTLGAELTLWTVGMFILNKRSRGFSIKNLKHLLSPPLVSIYFSLLVLITLEILDLSISDLANQSIFVNYIQKTIYQLGQATIPLSMIMVGGRMGKISPSDLKIRSIWAVTLFRLVVIPFVAIVVMRQLFPNHPFLNVMLIISVMPNSIASLVLGELFNADQKIMSGTVLVTHMVSLFTIPIWLTFLIAK
jgi:predicted permease